MPKIAYVERTFKPTTLATIDQANVILEKLVADGYTLTVRQLFYQFVGQALIPNTMRSYKRLVSIMTDARMAGLVDWEHIEDRTRNLETQPHWNSPTDILRVAAQQFALDKWADQDYYVEVWIEKAALIGVIEPVCKQLDVSYFACRGNVSLSEMWMAAQRLRRCATQGQTPIIIHLGDHDPSGLDMTRDIFDRLVLLGVDPSNLLLHVNRIALNMDQVAHYSLPPNPAKVTDSRYDKYADEYGTQSWELDALAPWVLVKLITDTVTGYRDEDKWLAMIAKQNDMRERLSSLAQDWRD